MLVLKNITIVTYFKLLGFHVTPYSIAPVFCLALLCYIITTTGNFLIIFLVLTNRRLQRPMYFFLCNLAFIDICLITTTVPNLLINILGKNKSISVFSCLIQLYIFFLSGTAEFLTLTVMSVDRYLAVCYPLHYHTLINRLVCIQIITGVWLGAFLILCIPFYLVMRLTFCVSEIDHFMCDVVPVLKNACINTAHLENCVFAASSVVIISFLVSFISYINIMIAVVKIRSVGGKERIISTCSSHAVAVSLLYGSCIFMYSLPKQIQTASFNKKVSIMNAILTPLMNPFFYTLRNKNVKEVVLGMLQKCHTMQSQKA
uniref:Olfactory receptor n=1 Tax=Pyxicephalus adspersus TaxID=30357 RepID=A0AAV3AL94_PYXAD|nr:TPA: hypothetical protein GDO54_013901 [Pyxicephalus adspersus]